ncbi:uncharacterized protein LOC127858444 [Dreissena polymorpha]|uniref:Uncharacterized protein n=1 Tax=Dreissena polymorpha TaxID=45954 RepID=A0A9D4BTD6_DREPO|nr:uncharacterized protein LOC127858444 [Dreissena polymorpha]KAH3707717.1 hypothetical protein DPMN_067128 [Dreissena polymorpha]
MAENTSHCPGDIANVSQSTASTAAIDQRADSAADAVKKCLLSVKVSRYDASEVERQMQGELFDKWQENCEVVKNTMIRFSNINEYLDHLQEAYEGIDEQTRKKMNGVLFSEGTWEYKMMEWKFNKGETSNARYGMIAFGRSPDGQFVDCMYVMYRMDFKIAPKKIVNNEEHSLLWGLITWTTSSEKNEERSLGLRTIEQLKNFFRCKAMEGFRDNGVIETINYVKSIEDAANDDIIKS